MVQRPWLSEGAPNAEPKALIDSTLRYILMKQLSSTANETAALTSEEGDLALWCCGIRRYESDLVAVEKGERVGAREWLHSLMSPYVDCSETSFKLPSKSYTT